MNDFFFTLLFFLFKIKTSQSFFFFFLYFNYFANRRSTLPNNTHQPFPSSPIWANLDCFWFFISFLALFFNSLLLYYKSQVTKYIFLYTRPINIFNTFRKMFLPNQRREDTDNWISKTMLLMMPGFFLSHPHSMMTCWQISGISVLRKHIFLWELE